MYVSIHNHSDHSNYRLRDAINRIPSLIDYTYQLGHKGIAITEHETIGSTVEALKYYFNKKKEDPDGWKDYKLILGNEIYLCNRKAIEEDKDYTFYHFILLAKDAIGHQQIRELSTRAWTYNSFMWVMQRVPTYYDDLIDIIGKNKGHVIGCSACLGGALPKQIIKQYEANPENPDYTLCEKWIKSMINIFGEGNFFLELQPHTEKNQQQLLVNKVLIELSEKTGVDYVISTDSHYQRAEDREIHKAFLNAQEGDREVDDFYETTYVMSEEEIHSYLDQFLGVEAVQLGIDNTMKIYDVCTTYDIRKPLEIPYIPDNVEEPDELLFLKYKDNIPLLEWFYNSEADCDRHLVREIVNALEEKPEEFDNQETYDAIEECLDAIKISSEKMETHWSAYLLQTAILVELCWNSGTLVGCSRGCFLADNKVLMANGQQKNIQDIQRGETIVTHLGKIHKVINTLCYEIEEEIAKVKVKGLEEIQCTKDHKFYVKTCEPCDNPVYKNLWCKESCRQYFGHCNYRKEQSLVWKKASELQRGDLVAYPKVKLPKSTIQYIDLKDYNPQAHCDKEYIWIGSEEVVWSSSKKFKRFIPFDEKFARFIGTFVGDGWVRANRVSEGGIAFHSQEEKNQENLVFCQQYLDELGINYSIRKHEKRHLIQLTFYGSIFGNMLQQLCGQGAINKHIPDMLMISNYSMIISLLTGLMASDGFYHSKELLISYDSINLNLVSQVKMLFASIGCFGNIKKRIAHDNMQDSYKWNASGKQLINMQKIFPRIIIPEQKYYSNDYMEDENNYFFKVEDVQYKQFKGKVYDLSVENEHSYVINNCAVHNSGGGFFLLYLLGITQINPLRENTKLYSWRFLNPERVSPLDIDIDIIGSDKDKVLQALIDKYGRMHVSKVQTLLTEKAKSSLLTSGRGVGATVEEATYLASFIKAERGMQYSLSQTYYGDENNGIKPDKEFIKLVDREYHDIWKVAQRIEGLISGTGSHAGGVILTVPEFSQSTALMKTNTGDVITQFDLHNAESVSLIKWDLLAIDALGRMKVCLELLLKDKVIEDQGSLRANYDKYLGIYNIERNDPKMWKMTWNREILSLFQMEKQSGVQAIALCKPNSVDDLSIINSVMRLMATEDGAEQPLEKFARFKNDISLWYKEMEEYGLTKEEQKILEPYVKQSYGICCTQECIMELVRNPYIGNFSLLWADRLRKAIGKKVAKDFEELEIEFFENQREKNLSKKLCEYVWYILIYPSKGYSFK